MNCITFASRKRIVAGTRREESGRRFINRYMAKYNIREKKEKEVTYLNLVNPELMDMLMDRIVDCIGNKKMYKEKSYSAKRLAIDIGTNTRYVSAVLNVRFGMNYTTFVNRYRVSEAMLLLKDDKYAALTMEDVSSMVGFANRQSFYAAFYRFEGVTPRQYKLSSAPRPGCMKVPEPIRSEEAVGNGDSMEA